MLGQEQIRVRAPYGYQGFYRAQGGRWDPDHKEWLLPLTIDMCKKLRSVHGDKLVISKSLNQWAWDARQAAEELATLVASASAELASVSVSHPALANAMTSRTYQQVGAAFIAKQKRALIADEPGLGKTLEAVAGLIEADCWRGLILVCAPLTSLRPVWERELARWASDAHTVIGVPKRQDNAAHRMNIQLQFMQHYVENPTQPHVLVVNPEMLRKGQFPVLEHAVWQGLVVDESHRYLSGIKSAKNLTQTGKGLMGLKLAEDGVKIALSGTPMRGRPSNLWGTLHWLKPKQYTSFYRWAETYFLSSANRWSSYGKVIGDINPRMEQALYKSLDDIMLRRTKAEVVKELPAKQRVDVVIEMTDAQERMYKAMAASAVAELEGMDLGDEFDTDSKLSAVGILAIMTRLKQFANCAWRYANVEGLKPKAIMHPNQSGKTAWIEEFLEERGIAGDDRQGENKVVIASQFTEVIDSLESYLNSINVQTLKITGAVRERDRVAVTEDFQSAGGARVLLMNTTAGGVSITLDAFCDELVIIDETWTPDDQEQLEDRIHRVSRIHQVTIYRLIGKDTIDEYIQSVTMRKDSVQKMVLDGRRGVDNLILGITT
jgi:SNF2 family DNA or RNA helicase